MKNLIQDLKFGFRMLLRKPGFSIIAILTLALGIGANTTIFSFVNAVMLRPLPFDEPDRLVRLWESNPRRNVEPQLVAPPNLAEWRTRTQSFEHIGYWSGTGDFNLVTADGSEKANCAYVTSTLFSVLRVRPHLGRVFLPEEDQLEGPRVALLSYDYWQRRFAANPQVIGRTMTVDTFGRRVYTIAGVLQPGLRFPNQTEVWLPVGWDGIPRQRRGPCLYCHTYLASRPTGFPQIIESVHNPTKPCITCHDPHKDTYGKFLLKDNRYSALCVTCHQMNGWSSSAHAAPRSSPRRTPRMRSLPHRRHQHHAQQQKFLKIMHRAHTS